MFIIHTTRDSKTMYVAEMTTQHLLHTIRLHFRALKKVLESVEKPEEANSFVNKLYERQTISIDDATNVIRQGVEKLYPYLAEAFFRSPEFLGNDHMAMLWGEVIDLMREVLGREAALPSLPGQPIILALKPGNVIVPADWLEDEEDDAEWHDFGDN